MLPIGTEVVIESVDHLGRWLAPAYLVGQTGVVAGHDDTGMNIVTGLSRLERLAGLRRFADDHITATGAARSAALPAWYRVAGYFRPDEVA